MHVKTCNAVHLCDTVSAYQYLNLAVRNIERLTSAVQQTSQQFDEAVMLQSVLMVLLWLRQVALRKIDRLIDITSNPLLSQGRCQSVCSKWMSAPELVRIIHTT